MSDAVLAAYLHPNSVSHSFSDSLMRLFAYDIQHAGHVARGGGPAMFRCGSGGLVEARNDVVKHFLSGSADWLWFVDSDMGFAPDTVDRLLEVADPATRPVVGGLCFGLRETAPDGLHGWETRSFPTLYDWGRKNDGETGFVVRRDYPVNAVTQVAGTGAACLLMHRSVLQRIADELGEVWFDRTRYPSGKPVSEDLSFCSRLGALGVPVFVHTGVRTNHHKQVWVSEQDYWASVQVPPATEQTAVIVPVMKRPQNAEPFMRSLRASTGLAKVFAVADHDDDETIAAWMDAGAAVFTFAGPRPGSFAEKVNFGHRTISPEWRWLFIVGDDVRFHPGWLDHAQHVAATQGAQVVGTNDLANPRVMSGQHGTHLLISRDYIAEQGASWDGPGWVCHEGYRHWFVDDEIVTVAKQRGVWASALGSRVEHLHPLVGKAPMDAVYERGKHNAARDGKLFRKRCTEHLTRQEVPA
ncbi:glycosyl transferase family 2 [Lentzea atacamensis]|uniref:Glycosyl transferase family 2 n=1 Tax=Lentzea atacamensis TaxID=531938 RepID=A0A316HKG9_9PSEU|nr:glycosyltransferase [Lentzea atacamensis]PWK81721.1 glycosyl transferase family 2 [Lentzea atacamensis]